MKDAYSFDVDQAGATHSYNKMFVAYLRTFARLGLKSIPMRAESGPIGGNLSHEFIILADTGESEVFCHKDFLERAVPDADVNFEDRAGLQQIVDTWTSQYAATSDMHDAAAYGQVPADKQVSARGIEVGHIFYFGTKYSAPMKAVVATGQGGDVPVHMGSYGIGPSRLVAAIIEASHDDAGIVWPEAIAPFKVALLNLKQGDAATNATCEELYRGLSAKGIDVLYDDTDKGAGAKFATADLIGLPWQVMVGPRGLAEGKVEVKNRKTGSKEMMSPQAALDLLTK
jgi:prolyl-tRNA synthetase